jgi:hypothetical protein
LPSTRTSIAVGVEQLEQLADRAVLDVWIPPAGELGPLLPRLERAGLAERHRGRQPLSRSAARSRSFVGW